MTGDLPGCFPAHLSEASRERFQPSSGAEQEEAAAENKQTDESPGAISPAAGVLQHPTYELLRALTPRQHS